MRLGKADCVCAQVGDVHCGHVFECIRRHVDIYALLAYPGFVCQLCDLYVSVLVITAQSLAPCTPQSVPIMDGLTERMLWTVISILGVQ